jgi:hypothetical protein
MFPSVAEYNSITSGILYLSTNLSQTSGLNNNKIIYLNPFPKIILKVCSPSFSFSSTCKRYLNNSPIYKNTVALYFLISFKVFVAENFLLNITAPPR